MTDDLKEASKYLSSLTTQLINHSIEARAMSKALYEETIKLISKIEGITEEAASDRIMTRYEHLRKEYFWNFKKAVFDQDGMEDQPLP